MSQRPISLSPDLKRLRNEGYEVDIMGGYLLIKHIPYVNNAREVAFGVLVSDLSLSGDIAAYAATNDHTVYFQGMVPCDGQGQPLNKIINSSGDQTLADGLVVNYRFSSKPPEGYRDYYDKMTTYIAILSSPAQAIDPNATAKTFAVVADDTNDSIFQYLDTASSRADINVITDKLRLATVAIVGLGGTGSYVLDQVAKTPVRHIHLFDGDRFLQHNAFRAPGAPSLDALQRSPLKVTYFQALYANMHRGIIAHDYFVDAANVEELRGMDFVFLSLTGSDTKRTIVTKLQEFAVPFIDMGMGLITVEGSLMGQVTVTASTEGNREHVWARHRIPFSDGEANNEYERNIQVADLNMLNAALAVIKWKKLFGFYVDLEHEHFSTYQVDGNHLINEDQS